jgi:hypothetical protein
VKLKVALALYLIVTTAATGACILVMRTMDRFDGVCTVITKDGL